MMKLEVEQLTKKYDDFVVYDNAELSIYKPGLYLIGGPNACGKTTLFNAISGFDSYDTGLIRINGNLMKKNQISKDVSYYNVDYNLIDLLTVKENLALVSDDYLDLVKKYGLEYVLDSKVSGISKGEKARIGILKNILLNKDIALFDEPFAYLDEDTAKEYIALLTEYAKDHIVLLISHVYKQFLPENKTVYTIENGKILLISSRIDEVNNPTAIAKPNENKTNNFLKNLKLSWKIIFNSKGKFITSLCLLFVALLVAIPALNFSYESTQHLVNRYLKEIGATYGNVIAEDYRNYIEHIDKTNEGTYIMETNYHLETSGLDCETNRTEFFSCNTKDIVIDNKTYTFNESKDYVELIVNENAKNHIYSYFGKDTFYLKNDRFGEYESFQLTKFKISHVVNFKNYSDEGFCLLNYKYLKNYTDNLISAVLPSCFMVYDENELARNQQPFFNPMNINGGQSIGNYDILNKKLNLEPIDLKDDEIIICKLIDAPFCLEEGAVYQVRKDGKIIKKLKVRKIINLEVHGDDVNENYKRQLVYLVNNNLYNRLSTPTQLKSCFTSPSEFTNTYISLDDLEKVINNIDIKTFCDLNFTKTDYEQPIQGIRYMWSNYNAFTDDFISMKEHPSYATGGIIISAVFVSISFIFLLIFNNENYKKNNYNIYVLRQNGYSSSRISFILVGSLIYNMLIPLICSIPAYYLVVFGLNKAFEHKATMTLTQPVLDRYPINYFPDTYKGYLTIIGIGIVILLLIYIIKLIIINNTKTKNYLDNKSHDE